jgi:hypothetical protein
MLWQRGAHEHMAWVHLFPTGRNPEAGLSRWILGRPNLIVPGLGFQVSLIRLELPGCQLPSPLVGLVKIGFVVRSCD